MVSIFHTMYYLSPIIQSSMIYIDDYQEHELALIIKYTFIIVSRAPIPTVVDIKVLIKRHDIKIRRDAPSYNIFH